MAISTTAAGDRRTITRTGERHLGLESVLTEAFRTIFIEPPKDWYEVSRAPISLMGRSAAHGTLPTRALKVQCAAMHAPCAAIVEK